jgi:hypothetical protein
VLPNETISVMAGALLLLMGCAGTRAPAPTHELKATTANAPELYDPFVGDAPHIITEALAEQASGKLLDIDLQRALFDYAHSHLDDARPWLLLARDSMARAWGGWAERQYASALEADPRVVSADGVLSDLMIVATDYQGSDQTEATQLIVEHWGDTAIPAIEQALADAELRDDEVRASHLQALRDALD